jgi:capsid portal protein
VYIERIEDSFVVMENGTTINISRNELFNYLVKLKNSGKMLMQKYIPSRTNTGEPFDIRLHLQKDGSGKWVNTLIYPKIGFKIKW